MSYLSIIVKTGLIWEAYLHPAVEGITHTDKDLNDTETGDVIDKLLKAWTKKLQRRDVSLLHRHYDVSVINKSSTIYKELVYGPHV